MTAALKICMVDEEFMRLGGRQRHVSSLSRELIRRGHKVVVKSPRGYHDWGLEVKPDARLDDYDIVHAHDTLKVGLRASKTKRFFVTTHGLYCRLNCGHGLLGKMFHRYYTDRVLGRANRKGCVICVSDYDLRLCKELGLDNSFYVPNGVDFDAIQGADGKKFREKYHIGGEMVLLVGRLFPAKGQLRFVEDCAEKIQREVGDVHFVFAGDQEDYPCVQKLVTEIKTRGIRASVIPDIPDEDLYQAYGACDVFVLPSEFEGQPISVMEAFAAGKPVVATDVGGIKGFAGPHASVVPFWEPDEFAGEVARLLGDEGSRRELGAGALEYVKQFSWGKVAEFVERKYLEVARR